MTILGISGSLRKDSTNTALLRAMRELAPAGMNIDIADLSVLPIYNQDAETAFPAEVRALKDAIAAADGLIITTPEYNRSIPGVLKNAIDWLSRPYGENSFLQKTVLIGGVSMGKIGTAVAQSHLKQILIYLDADVIGQPELYIGPSQTLFNEKGILTDDATKELVQKALSVLALRAA